MREFCLERALAGAPVVTRGSRETVTQLHLFDAEFESDPLCGVIDGKVYHFKRNGKYIGDNEDHDRDLFMETTLRQGWVNIYSHNEVGQFIYGTKDSAILSVNAEDNLIDTVRIEWEE